MLQVLTPFRDILTPKYTLKVDILHYMKSDFIWYLLILTIAQTHDRYTLFALSDSLSLLCPSPKLRDFLIHVSVSVRCECKQKV